MQFWYYGQLNSFKLGLKKFTKDTFRKLQPCSTNKKLIGNKSRHFKKSCLKNKNIENGYTIQRYNEGIALNRDIKVKLSKIFRLLKLQKKISLFNKLCSTREFGADISIIKICNPFQTTRTFPMITPKSISKIVRRWAPKMRCTPLSKTAQQIYFTMIAGMAI